MDAQSEGRSGTSRQPSAISCQSKDLKESGVGERVRANTGAQAVRVRSDTRRGLSVPADAVPPHDFEQTRVIGEPQRLRRPGDVPVVALEGRDDDLALGLGLELLEGAR